MQDVAALIPPARQCGLMYDIYDHSRVFATWRLALNMYLHITTMTLLHGNMFSFFVNSSDSFGIYGAWVKPIEYYPGRTNSALDSERAVNVTVNVDIDTP